MEINAQTLQLDNQDLIHGRITHLIPSSRVWVEVPLQASVLQGPYLLLDTWNKIYSCVSNSVQIWIQCLNITCSLSSLKSLIRVSHKNKHSNMSHYYSLNSYSIWNAIHKANLKILKFTQNSRLHATKKQHCLRYLFILQNVFQMFQVFRPSHRSDQSLLNIHKFK